MAGYADVVAALDKFQLDLVDQQWIHEIWNSEFTDCPEDLPDEYSEHFSTLNYADILELIDEAHEIIVNWLNNNDEQSISITGDSNTSIQQSGPSWIFLREINYRALLAVLFFYISKGQTNTNNGQAVHTCIKATNLYFTLLTIPKSHVYKIFQCGLFEKCLDTFLLYKHLEIMTGKSKKKAKSKRNDFNEVDDDSDNEFTGDVTLTLSQEQNIVRQLNFLLSSFSQLLTCFNFKGQAEALKLTIKVLVEITRTERFKTVEEFFRDKDQQSFAPYSRNAYLVLKGLCSQQHGNVSEIVRLILFHMFPSFTLIGGSRVPEMTKFTNKELNNIRSIAVSFLTSYILTLGDASNYGVKILIQQICHNMLDRADYRLKATEMVMKIMSGLPMDVYYELVKWIIQQAMREGAGHRVVGLELLSKLIYQKPGSEDLSCVATTNTTNDSVRTTGEDTQTEESIPQLTESRVNSSQSQSTSNISQGNMVSFSKPITHVPIEYRRTILAVIIDRIRDEAPTVKSKALSVLAELLTNKDSPAVRKMIADIFITPYEGHESIEDCKTKENTFLPWKNFTSIIEKIREPDINDRLTPGAKAIVKKVFEKCLEERVSVRKSALQVIVRIFRINPKWMTYQNLQFFGRHCRDPATSIRREMVGMLTDLMLYYPEHEELVRLWVEEVVPQIIDRETRVQEHVQQIFVQTLFENITSYNDMRQTKHRLPWKLLTCIGQKRMKSFLVAACGLLNRTNNLRQQWVKMAATHVFTENNSAVWVLLSAMSEFLDFERCGFVVDYYLPNCQAVDDIFTVHLALRVLHNCWHKLDRNVLESLKTEMLEALSSFSVHNTLISLTLDVAAAITVFLAEDEMTGKHEIAQYASDLIQVCETYLEDCLSPSRAEIEENEKFVRSLGVLGCLSSICPDKIKHSTFFLLLNFLVPSFANGVYKGKYTVGMKAIAVITVAKISLGDSNYARTFVNALSHLLVKSSDPMLLNNVIVAVADIGERYANLIEPLIPSVCLCLKNKEKSVANMTLLLLIELLQEEYLKPRGSLVYHLLTLINDQDPTTVNTVKYYFTGCLLAREPSKVYQLILPSFFHYNLYYDHPNYPKLEMSNNEARVFNISGVSNHSKRMNIYKFLVSRIPSTLKLKVIHFLNCEILKDVAESVMPIEDKRVQQLLYDALTVLISREAKVDVDDITNRKSEEDGDHDDNADVPVQIRIAQKYFSEARRKEIVETYVPICKKLRKTLSSKYSRLLPLLIKYTKSFIVYVKDLWEELFQDDKEYTNLLRYELDKSRDEDDDGIHFDDEEEQEQVPATQTHGIDPAEMSIASALSDMGRKRQRSSCELDMDELSVKVKKRTVSSEEMLRLTHSLKEVEVVVERLNDHQVNAELSKLASAESEHESSVVKGESVREVKKGSRKSSANLNDEEDRLIPHQIEVEAEPSSEVLPEVRGRGDSNDVLSNAEIESVAYQTTKPECKKVKPVRNRSSENLIEEYDPAKHDPVPRRVSAFRYSGSSDSRHTDIVEMEVSVEVEKAPNSSPVETQPPQTQDRPMEVDVVGTATNDSTCGMPPPTLLPVIKKKKSLGKSCTKTPRSEKTYSSSTPSTTEGSFSSDLSPITDNQQKQQ